MSRLLWITLLAATLLLIPWQLGYDSAMLAAGGDVSIGWTAIRPTAIVAGTNAGIETRVQAKRALSATVEAVVSDGSGRVAWRKLWTDETFAPWQTRAYTTTWNVPTSQPAGAYLLTVRVVTSDAQPRAADAPRAMSVDGASAAAAPVAGSRAVAFQVVKRADPTPTVAVTRAPNATATRPPSATATTAPSATATQPARATASPTASRTATQPATHTALPTATAPQTATATATSSPTRPPASPTLAPTMAPSPTVAPPTATVSVPSPLTDVPPACTLYASPGGSSSNSGAAPSSPLTLVAARDRTVPGSVVCLLGGAYAVDTPFEITRSGTPSAWITYRSLTPGTATLVPASGAWDLFQVYRARYIEVRDLHFDGRNVASNGVACKGGHHVRAIGNVMRNLSWAGIATYRDPDGVGCDYITADRNQVHLSGYGGGWSSGISLNSHRWVDGYAGFHSVIVNNIISGQVDTSGHHTDGNGIIIDLGGAVPLTLIANNVVYQNGGRCIHTLTSGQAWIVHNTCYANALDPQVQGGAYGNNGEFAFSGSSGNVLINNIAYAVGQGRPYSDEAGTPAIYRRNLWFSTGSASNYLPASIATDPSQVRRADPLFVDPPAVDQSAPAPYARALPPWQLGQRLHLRPGSPAIDAGIDPATAPGVTPAILAGLQAHVYRDLAGRNRPGGIGFDIGAYEATAAP